ncbi:ATP-binding protein [Peribacillus sp. SCS-155]|uniref:ATP-binding protein n=1 Tax=Peribacillus sedimenti TaxID=3115297 RepID=UPI0039069AF0
MGEQLSHIAELIKDKQQFLTDKVLTFQNDRDTILKSDRVRVYTKECLGLLFNHLNDTLVSCEETAIKNNHIYGSECGQLAFDSSLPPEIAVEAFIEVRNVFHDYLYSLVKNGFASALAVLRAIRIIDNLIDQASICLINHYNNILTTTKSALAESSKDLNITLKELNELKDALNESTIFAITDQKDNILYANDKFCEISKYSSEELIGSNHHILNSGNHPKEFFDEIWKTIQKGEVWNGEIMNKAKDGSCYWVDTTIIPYQDKDGKTYKHISIQKDLTQQKKAEELLHKTEKLSLVGELAAGIAHEIRNPLTTIKGFVQLLSKSLPEKDQPFSETILSEIDRINFIVSEFMVFAKPHAVYFSKCDVSEILMSVIHLVSAEALLKNVTIMPEMKSTPPMFIYGEMHQLKQVFLNMIKNGIEAMPYGGSISISITEVDGNIQISFVDNGVGMTPEQMERLGEPFYTTKDSGNGLGLMVSYKIIQNHRGQINVKSNACGGTTFEIVFPAI